MDKHQNTVDDLKNWQDLWSSASKKFNKQPQNIDAVVTRLCPPEKNSERPLELYEMFVVSDNIDRIFGKPCDETVNGPKDVTKSINGEIMVNPTHFASLGKDQELRVTPNFTDGDVLRELNALKLALHILEDKVNTAYAVGTEKQENTLRKEMDSIRSKVEELSNKMTPHPIEDPS